MLDWALRNIELISFGALLGLSLINAYATKYADDVDPGIKRLLLWALDWVSALRSRGSDGEGQVKLPLLQVSKREDFFHDLS